MLEAEGLLDDAAQLGVVHGVGLSLEPLRPDALPQPRQEPGVLLLRRVCDVGVCGFGHTSGHT